MRSLYEIATEYCSRIEHSQKSDSLSSEWLSRILAEAIHVAFTLPDDGMSDASADGYEGPDYIQIRDMLPALPIRRYHEVFDATDSADTESIVRVLDDDVADIYRNLHEGLHLHAKVSPAEAERYWRQSFRYHWGHHATSALRVLYCTLRNEVRDD